MADAADRRPPVIQFDYLKSQAFRVIHVDGVIGGFTSKGLLMLGLWNERAPIPKQVTHSLVVENDASAATLGPEVSELRIGREAMVREVEVAALMDYGTAKALHKWLHDHLEEYRKLRVKQQPTESSE